MIIRSPVQASVDNIVPQWVGTTLHGSCLLLVYTGKYLHFIFHTHLLIALIALIERRPIYRSDLLVKNSPIWPPWALYREYLHSLGSFCSRMRMSYLSHHQLLQKANSLNLNLQRLLRPRTHSPVQQCASFLGLHRTSPRYCHRGLGLPRHRLRGPRARRRETQAD